MLPMPILNTCTGLHRNRGSHSPINTKLIVFLLAFNGTRFDRARCRLSGIGYSNVLLKTFHFCRLPVGNFPMPMGKAFQESHLTDYTLLLQTPQDLLLDLPASLIINHRKPFLWKKTDPTTIRGVNSWAQSPAGQLLSVYRLSFLHFQHTQKQIFHTAMVILNNGLTR